MKSDQILSIYFESNQNSGCMKKRREESEDNTQTFGSVLSRMKQKGELSKCVWKNIHSNEMVTLICRDSCINENIRDEKANKNKRTKSEANTEQQEDEK